MRSVLANHDDPNDEIDPLSTGSVDDILHPRPSSSARGERRMQTIPEDTAPNSDPIDEEAADSDNAKPTYYFDEILDHNQTKSGQHKFQVQWNNGEITWEPERYLREDSPGEFAVHLRA